MGALDWGVIGAYAAAVIALGLASARRAAGAEDYFMASRRMAWPTIGLALLASNISSTTLVGLPGAAYASGISVFNYEWMAAVVLVFFCFFFLPIVLRSRVFTLPEFLERRYDGRARLFFSALTIFLNVVVDTAGTLYGGALMFKLLFPDLPLTVIVAALALSAAIYTVAGGLRAVMITETVQAVVLLAASVFIAVAAFEHAGGWNAVMGGVAPEKLSLIRPIGDAAVPWPGLLFGVPILGFYFWCTNQFMVQRVLAARDERHGRWGCLFAGFLKLPVLFVMVLPGTAAILIYENLESPDLVYPTLLFSLLPAGILGLVVAGFLAALMSSIAATFNSASTLLTMDFVRRLRPGLEDSQLVRVGRIATLCIMGLAVLWAPQIERFASLWEYLQSVLAYACPPIVALYLGGLFWKRASAAGAFAAICTGAALGGALFYGNAVGGFLNLHFLYIAPILLAASAAALVIGSLLRPGPAADPELLFSRRAFATETRMLAALPLLQNYRFLSLLLLAATAVLVWCFR